LLLTIENFVPQILPENFQQKNGNAVDEGSYEYALCSLIFFCIEENGEQHSIGKKGNATDTCQE
jgi:hypothetical protein